MSIASILIQLMIRHSVCSTVNTALIRAIIRINDMQTMNLDLPRIMKISANTVELTGTIINQMIFVHLAVIPIVKA